MGNETESIQKKNTQKKSDNEPRADFFGGIVPAAHAENRLQGRRHPGEKKVILRAETSGKRSERGLWQKRILFFLISLFLFYAATMYLVVPAVMQGPLARQAGQILGCRLSVGKFYVSPFTFRFRVKNVVLEPQTTENGKRPWLKAAAVTGRLQLLPLLQGRVRVGDLYIDRPEVFLLRDGSGRYNLPTGFSHIQKVFERGRWGLEPDIFSFQIVDGTFIFDDQLTGNTHRVEQIVYFPDGKGGLRLQAMVNGSPVIVSRDDVSNSGGEHQLQLQLNDVELGRYLAYLPRRKALPVFVSGRADGALELQLPNRENGGRFAVEGVLELKGVLLDSKQAGVKLDISAARFSFESTFPAGRLRVRELILREPAFVFSAEAFPALLMELDPWMEKTSFHRLLIDQGRVAVQAGEQTFHFQDLQGSIREGTTKRAGNGLSPATFQLSARQAGDMHGELTVEGKLAPGKLNGHLRMRGFDLAHLPGKLGENLGLSGLEGDVELDSEIVFIRSGRDHAQHLLFRNNKLQLHDFQLQARGRGELSGKSLLCQASVLSFDKNSSRPLCDRLDLVQAEMTLKASELARSVQKERGNGRLPLFCDLEIKDSTVHVTGKNQEKLVSLERVLVQIHGFPGQAGNPGKIGLRAGIGENGQVRLSGSLNQGKSQLGFGLSDVRLTDVPIIQSWLPLPVKEGRIRARGQLILPEAKAEGTVVVEDFLAGEASHGSLQWRQLTATGTRMQMYPPLLSIDEAVLNSPVIKFQQGTDGFLFPFASDLEQNAWWRDTVVLKKITFENGGFQSGREGILPGLYPALTGLTGEIEGWPGDPFSFDISGRLEESNWRVKGWAGKNTGNHDYTVQGEALPLAPFAEVFLQAYGLEAGSALLSWQQQIAFPDMDGKESLCCVLKNLRPQPGSPLESTLAFLTDTNEDIVLSPAQTMDDGQPRLLLARVIDNLQRIRLRELVLSGSTVQEQLPFLELPDTLQFQVGRDSSDELFLLDDYVELLQRRPHLHLVVEGSFDPDIDGAMLREILQEEADARLEVENLRRQQKRAQWLRLQKQQTGESPSPGHSVESVLNKQLPEDIQPLPQHLIELPAELLENLAGKRAEQVRQYFITEKGIAPERVSIRKTARSGAAAAFLSLEPFYPTVHDGGLDDN